MTTGINRFRSLFASLAIAVSALLSLPAQAGDGGISIPLPPIPKIKLHAPPLMVWLPTPAVYVALDSPYPIFAHDDRYYLHNNGSWYVGPGYSGPWTFVHVHLIPHGLRHYNNHEWGHYQHQARYWQHHDHRAHPHFYGHHRVEHYESRVPGFHGEHRSREDHHSRRHDSHDRVDSHWQSHRQPTARHKNHDYGHYERSERAHNPGHAQIKNHGHDRDMARARVRGDDRDHGNKHWRMGY